MVVMLSKWADNVHVCVCACVLFGDFIFIKHVIPCVCVMPSCFM